MSKTAEEKAAITRDQLKQTFHIYGDLNTEWVLYYGQHKEGYDNLSHAINVDLSAKRNDADLLLPENCPAEHTR